MIQVRDVTIAPFARGLGNLKGMLRKGEMHVASLGVDPVALLSAKLAADMYDLAGQVRWAADGANVTVARLLGVDVVLGEEPKTFADLHTRIDVTVARLGEVDDDALDVGLARTIELTHRGATKSYVGRTFITEFALPSFYFHLVSAYGILRREGVPLQKGDFMGG